MNLQIIDIIEDTAVDGPGFRTAVYAAGCSHQCPGCHNPESWDKQAGKSYTIEEVFSQIKADPFSNVTFTGGDPMFQPEGFTQLAQLIKTETQKNIWCYTGFCFEELLQMPKQNAFLAYIDVLVDGRFIQALRSEEIPFRGSSNQRLIDVQASLQLGKTVIWEYNPKPVF